MNIKRTELAEGVGFSELTDSKFKTCSVYIKFITKLDQSTASANAIASGVLSVSNSKLPSLAALNEKLSELYGASLNNSVRKYGDMQLIGLSASWIADRYTLEGENITGDMLNIVCDCLFHPNISGSEFESSSFSISKNDILDTISAEFNNKRGHAITQAVSAAFRTEPAAVSVYGTKETAEAVTSAEAYAAYLELMRTARIEIYLISPEPITAAANQLKNCFAGLERCPEEMSYDSLSPLKASPETVEETAGVNQCKTVLVFKSELDDQLAFYLMNNILGGSSVSKLFLNVREKQSLCYYCSSRYLSSKNALLIDSGVEKGDIPQAEAEILRQLDEICSGNISEQELESAMLTFENSLASVGDTPSSYASWMFDNFLDGCDDTPAQRWEMYRAVTKDRIVQAAKSLKLDCIYHMLSTEGESQ